MRILAFDTATMTASVALVDRDGDQVTAIAADEREVTTHSDVLLELVDSVLATANTTVAAVDGVAVGVGPGSFTGLRIAMATAKGLCFAERKPLLVASSLAAMALDVIDASGLDDGARVAPVFDAKKGEVFAGLFEVRDGLPEPIADEVAVAPEDFAAFVAEHGGDVVSASEQGAAAAGIGAPVSIAGTGALAYPDDIGPAGTVLRVRHTPSALSIARLAVEADTAAAKPAYRRPPDIR